MILTCPSCATSYSVDETKLGSGGRTVRCAACGERWTARAESELELTATVVEDALPAPEPSFAETPLAEVPAEALPKAMRARAEEKKTVRAAVAHGVAWAGIAACLAVTLAAGAVFRVDIVRMVPRTAGAYAMVGLPVNPTGLVFEGVSAHPALQGGHNALVVSGQIRNIQNRAITPPPLKIKVLDKAGKAVAAQVTGTGPAHLAPGETRHFVIAVLNPPVSADDVEVGFATLRAATPARPKAKHETPNEHAALRGTTKAGPPPPIQAVDASPLPASSPYALDHQDHG